MKKIVSIIITISILISIFIIPVSAQSTVYTYEDYKYKVVNNSVEITDYVGNSKDLSIPEQIDGKNVTTIGKYAFSGTGIQSVIFPDTIVSIRNNSFSECEKLKKVHFGNSLKKIEKEAFRADGITNMILPNSVVSIGERAFVAANLHYVKLGDGLKKLGNEVFALNKSLKEINVSKSNNHFSSKKGILYNKKGTKLIQYPIGNKKTKFIIPKTVKTIGISAVQDNKYLKKVFFNKKLISISDNAFSGNINLKSIKLKKRVKNLGKLAFENCKRITSVILSSKIKRIKLLTFGRCKKLKRITISKSIKRIDKWAFFNSGIKEIKFNSKRKLILGQGVFLACKNLTMVTLPRIKSSKGSMFDGCTKIKKVIIPKYVKKIYNKDFLYCKKLKTVTIPKNIKKIGNYSLGYNGTYHENYPKIKGFTIKGYKGTVAEKYAKKNKFKFVALG